MPRNAKFSKATKKGISDESLAIVRGENHLPHDLKCNSHPILLELSGSLTTHFFLNSSDYFVLNSKSFIFEGGESAFFRDFKIWKKILDPLTNN